MSRKLMLRSLPCLLSPTNSFSKFANNHRCCMYLYLLYRYFTICDENIIIFHLIVHFPLFAENIIMQLFVIIQTEGDCLAVIGDRLNSISTQYSQLLPMARSWVPNFEQKIIWRKTKQDGTEHKHDLSEFCLFPETKNLRNYVPSHSRTEKIPESCYESFRGLNIVRKDEFRKIFVVLFRRDVLFRVISFCFVPFLKTKQSIPRNTEFRVMTALFRVIKKFVSSLISLRNLIVTKFRWEPYLPHGYASAAATKYRENNLLPAARSQLSSPCQSCPFPYGLPQQAFIIITEPIMAFFS